MKQGCTSLYHWLRATPDGSSLIKTSAACLPALLVFGQVNVLARVLILEAELELLRQ